MGSSKVIHALYTDDDVLLAAVKTVKNEKHHIEEIFKNKVDVILSPATPCVAPLFKKDVMKCGIEFSSNLGVNEICHTRKLDWHTCYCFPYWI